MTDQEAIKILKKDSCYECSQGTDSHTISEWPDITGINRSTLNNRYYRGDRGKRLIRKTR